MKANIELIKCAKCGKEKPKTEFFKRKDRLHELQFC
jgi:hypothetical protein